MSDNTKTTGHIPCTKKLGDQYMTPPPPSSPLAAASSAASPTTSAFQTTPLDEESEDDESRMETERKSRAKMQAEMGFSYWTSRQPALWDPLEYHKTWVEAGFPLSKGNVVKTLRKQLRWFQVNGSYKEKTSAKKTLEKHEVDIKRNESIYDYWRLDVKADWDNLKQEKERKREILQKRSIYMDHLEGTTYEILDAARAGISKGIISEAERHRPITEDPKELDYVNVAGPFELSQKRKHVDDDVSGEDLRSFDDQDGEYVFSDPVSPTAHLPTTRFRLQNGH